MGQVLHLACWGQVASARYGCDEASRPVAIKCLNSNIIESRNPRVMVAYQRAVSSNTVVGSWQDSPHLMSLLGIMRRDNGQVAGFVWDYADVGNLQHLACDNDYPLRTLAIMLSDVILGVAAVHRYDAQYLHSSFLSSAIYRGEKQD